MFAYLLPYPCSYLPINPIKPLAWILVIFPLLLLKIEFSLSLSLPTSLLSFHMCVYLCVCVFLNKILFNFGWGFFGPYKKALCCM